MKSNVGPITRYKDSGNAGACAGNRFATQSLHNNVKKNLIFCMFVC